MNVSPQDREQKHGEIGMRFILDVCLVILFASIRSFSDSYVKWLPCKVRVRSSCVLFSFCLFISDYVVISI